MPEAGPVGVEMVVTGLNHQPVSGLTIADFHLFEDGREQPITGFRSHSGPAIAGISPQQYVALLIGPQSEDQQKWIQQAASKFITDNAGPNRLIAIIYTDACYETISTPFTSESGKLQQALSAWPDLLHCESIAARNNNLRALYYAQIARGLGQVPGHKAAVLFAANAGPTADEIGEPPATLSTRHGRARSEEKVEAHADPFDMELEFRKSDVSVYPVISQAGPLPAWELSLAEATGGRELSAADNAPAVFEQLASELDGSYTVTYLPKISGEGTCHPLKVECGRPGMAVRGRNLYCNVRQPSPAAVRPKESELENLAASSEGGNTAASVSVPYFYEANGVARVSVTLEVPSPVLDPIELNGRVHAEMEVLGLAYVPGGALAARFTQRVKYDFDNRRQLDEFLRRPLRYQRDFEVLPGNYEFKIAFRTGKDRLGAVEVPLAIDPFRAGQLCLSAIALSRDIQPVSEDLIQDARDQGKNLLVFRGRQFTVSGSDVLPKAGPAEAYFEVYDPLAGGGAALQLSLRMDVFDAQNKQPRWSSGEIDLSSLAKAGNRSIPVAIKLPVSTLPPGSYQAEFAVKDSAGGRATRATQFRVE